MDELSKVIADIMAENGDEEQKSASGAPEGNTFSNLAGLMGFSPPSNPRMELLTALKPHLSGERREKVDRICGLVKTAYMIRGALSSLGGLIHV